MGHAGICSVRSIEATARCRKSRQQLCGVALEACKDAGMKIPSTIIAATLACALSGCGGASPSRIIGNIVGAAGGALLGNTLVSTAAAGAGLPPQRDAPSPPGRSTSGSGLRRKLTTRSKRWPVSAWTALLPHRWKGRITLRARGIDRRACRPLPRRRAAPIRSAPRHRADPAIRGGRGYGGPASFPRQFLEQRKLLQLVPLAFFRSQFRFKLRAFLFLGATFRVDLGECRARA